MKNRINNKNSNQFFKFFRNESMSGLVLIGFTIIAIIIGNSNYAITYNHILHTYITIGYKEFSLSMSVLHWINDGLMVIFFLVAGMEIKRELVFGELKSFKKAILPISAAIGGMIVPAIIFTLFNYKESTITGWGIPMATDIAFALGILSLVGRKAPKGIAVFLTALAIVDDLGAIIIIAIFYTSQISWMALIIGLLILIGLILANRFEVKFTFIYVIGGILLWICVLKSGIHSTIAGVLFGMVLPIGKDINEFKTSVLHKLEEKLVPWSSFVVMPIFALANSGINIDVSKISTIIFEPISLGIVLGLFVGKQAGIFLSSYILIKLKIAKLPYQVNKMHLYGASVLGGIGFTMSLFISSLSFTDTNLLSTAKLSIMLVSVLSALLGIAVFKSIKTSDNLM